MDARLPTLFLRRRRFSLVDGLARVFPDTPVTAGYHTAPTADAADAQAIAADFLITGDDLRAALALHGDRR